MVCRSEGEGLSAVKQNSDSFSGFRNWVYVPLKSPYDAMVKAPG